MKDKARRNLGASVQARILNLSLARREENQLLLERFAIERFLYRLGRSDHRNAFVLKGAMLFRLWTSEIHRPTRDADFLAFGELSPSRLAEIFREICRGEVEEDGVAFPAESVVAERIQAGKAYVGVRLKLRALIGTARLQLQADVGFGDVVHPEPRKEIYPALLDFPSPHLRVYPREAVVAEKLEALIRFGSANTRLKDFFDLWYLSRRFAFDGLTVATAIRKTFVRRRTPLPVGLPDGLSEEFLLARESAWNALFRRGLLREEQRTLSEVGEHLRRFLLPPLEAVGRQGSFEEIWLPGGPWKARQ